MVAVFQTSCSNENLHDAFLSLVPKIETHARIAFSYLKCVSKKADKVAEAVALAWKWFLRLLERGKSALEFPMAFTVRVIRAIASGRRLVGAEPVTDVMSMTARWKHGVSVTLFPHTNAVPIQDLHGDPHGQETCDALEERLADDTQTPVPDQAAFRIDFPLWLRTLSLRERKMVKAMMRDERTNDLSRTFGVSAGRISQIRGDLRKSWTGFCGEGV